jgi:invasion protein IalB
MRSAFAALIVAGLALCAGTADAQQGAKQQPKAASPRATQPSPAQAAPAQDSQPQSDASSGNAQPGWVARCTSVSRDAPPECAIEQSAVLTKTGQLIVLVDIRVAADTRQPAALIQLPLGLNLPVGAKLQVDEGKAIDLPIQTCEQRGCYISAPVSAELLASLKSGKQLKISFQNMAKETISIPMPLSDFAAAYDKIK